MSTQNGVNMELNVKAPPSPIIDHPLKPDKVRPSNTDKLSWSSAQKSDIIAEDVDEIKTNSNDTKPDWTCLKCTFSNSPYSLTCAMCLAPKASSYKSSLNTIEETKDDYEHNELSTVDWQCTACTFINQVSITNCEICGLPKIKPNMHRLQIPNESSEISSHQISQNDDHSPIADYDADNDTNTDWICSLCNSMNDDNCEECKNCANSRDKMVWKRKNIELESNDWICKTCDFENDWQQTGQIQEVACCLKCGTPNVDDMIPELEECNVKCRKCGTLLQSESDLCYECIARNGYGQAIELNTITNIAQSIEREYEYNELTEDEQLSLVRGYCRKYTDSEHALWNESVLWCFSCYVVRDYLDFTEHFYGNFIGNVRTLEDYVYCWRLRVVKSKKDGRVGEMDSVLIGLGEAGVLDDMIYGIESNGTKYGFGDRAYCRPLRFGDVVIVRYEKKEKKLSFGVNDKWYGVAFEDVQKSEYQIMARVDVGSSMPIVQLLDFHWTQQ